MIDPPPAAAAAAAAAAAIEAADDEDDEEIRGEVRLKALKSFCGVLTAWGTPPLDSSEVSESMWRKGSESK